MMFTKNTIPLTLRITNPCLPTDQMASDSYLPTDQMDRPGLCLYSPLPMAKNMTTEIPKKVCGRGAVENVNIEGIPPQKAPNSCSSLQQKKEHNIGVWGPAEHEKFMEALHLYGNNWQKIEKHIATRTTVQIRSHCQKYFKTIKDRKYRALKKTNMLGKEFFIVTREYRNVSNIVQKHPHELLIEKLPNTGKRILNNPKKLKQAQTTMEGNNSPASHSLYYPNDLRLFAMNYPTNKIQEPTEPIASSLIPFAMRDCTNQAISSNFLDITIPKPQYDPLIDDY